MKNKKKIINILITVFMILVSLIGIYLFINNLKKDKIVAKEKKVIIIPTVVYKTSSINVLQEPNTEISFDGTFKYIGNKNFYYKWFVYKNGSKVEESSCRKVNNNHVDSRKIKIDSERNYGKWVIYSDSSCIDQSMFYITLTYTAKRNNTSPKNYVVTFDKNQATSISKNKLECSTKTLTCTVVAPSITAPQGYEPVGWGLTKDSTKSIYKPGKKILVTKDTKYYAIIKKSNSSNNTTKSFTATFNRNNASYIGKNSSTCSTKYSSCTIIAPSITAPAGYEVIGWSTNRNQTGSTYNVGSSITLYSNQTFYAITKKKNASTSSQKTFTISFYKNTASSIGNNSLSCTTSSNSCSIKLPSINAKSGYSALGWSTNSSATSAMYKVGTTISISSNINLYAITKKNDNSSISMSKYTDTWQTGTGGPLNIKVSPSNSTYTVTSSNTDVMIIFNDNLYAIGPGTATITAKSSTGKTISYTYKVVGKNLTLDTSKIKNGIASQYTVGKTKVFVEKGCPSSYASMVKSDINEMPKNILESAQVIYLLKTSSYVAANNGSTDSAGMAHSYGFVNYIDVNCDYQQDEVISHEIGHTFDYYSPYKTGLARFSKRSDLVLLYNKHSSSSALRGYSFTSTGEFFADSFAYYFKKNIAKTNKLSKSWFKTLKYPKDIENLIGHYITEWNNL